MKVEIWPIEKPTPYARNPRQIPQIAIDKVAASIQEFVFRQPIVVDTQCVIIVGHVRILAAQKLGLTEVPVHVATELTVSQVNAYRLADNRTNEEATWDMEALTLELANLKLDDFDLDLCGFPAPRFHEGSLFCDAIEGISFTSCTSPYSPYSLRFGSCFQPQLRQHLYRCDQIRRSIQWSSLLKSVPTWARL